MKKHSRPEIPRKAVYRLSIYLRCLLRLKENGLPTISSDALARAAGVKPTQLRKDLAYFGEFGVRGVGYHVRDLRQHLRQILGLDRTVRVAIFDKRLPTVRLLVCLAGIIASYRQPRR